MNIFTKNWLFPIKTCLPSAIIMVTTFSSNGLSAFAGNQDTAKIQLKEKAVDELIQIIRTKFTKMLGSPTIDFQKKTTDELIQMLREKYKIHSIEDVRTWDSPKEIQSTEEARMSFAKKEIIPLSYKAALSVLFGFRPVGLDTDLFYPYKGEDPLLFEILSRQDCPLKFIIYPTGEQYPLVYMYNARAPQGEHDAYLLARYDLERLSNTIEGSFDENAIKEIFYKSAYIDGKILSYPEDAIKAYVAPQNWSLAQRLGQEWLNNNKDKSIEQLKKENSLYVKYLTGT